MQDVEKLFVNVGILDKYGVNSNNKAIIIIGDRL